MSIKQKASFIGGVSNFGVLYGTVIPHTSNSNVPEDSIASLTEVIDYINSSDDGSSDITQGIDTSDATATSADISALKTAYVNGNKITGSLEDIASGHTIERVFNNLTTESDNLKLIASSSKDAIVRAGANVSISVPLSNFGDATASDVAAGKKFTSSNGVSIVGTKQEIPRLADDEEIYSSFPDVEDASFDSYSTGMYIRTRITGLPDGEQRIVQNGDPIYIDAIYDREHSYSEYATDEDVRQGKIFRGRLLGLRTGTAVDTQVNGTFTINSNVNSYSISTNLSTIHGFHVSIKETSSTAKSNTWDFNGTSGFVIAKTQYTYTASAISASYYSISGSTLTIKQHSSSYPIVAGEYIYTIW